MIVAFGAERGEDGLEREAADARPTSSVDLVVYNDVSRDDIGFDATDNEVVADLAPPASGACRRRRRRGSPPPSSTRPSGCCGGDGR